MEHYQLKSLVMGKRVVDIETDYGSTTYYILVFDDGSKLMIPYDQIFNGEGNRK